MAYVLWRVVMKKYSRVRLGLTGGLVSQVTPATDRAITYDEESWKPAEEETVKDKKDLSRSSDARQSKTKKVKNYLKKCKSVLSSKSASLEVSSSCNESNATNSSIIDSQIEENLSRCEVNELDEVFEDAQDVDVVPSNSTSKYQVANIIEVRGARSSENKEDSGEVKEETEETKKETETSSPNLKESQVQDEGRISEGLDEAESKPVKSDVENLVDKYFGDLYKNYQNSRKCLIRQARDLLVCEYHGCLQRFEKEFCIQAHKLLQHIKNERSSDTISSSTGWPLSLDRAGVVINLNQLDPSLVRNKDCYLCVKRRTSPGLEIALIWRLQNRVHCLTVAEFRNPLHSLDDIMCSSIRSASDLDIEDVDGSELPDLLQSLLVSVEHAIKRVPLDDLTFPCPQCLQFLPVDKQDDEASSCSCQCSCRLPDSPVLKRDSSIQTSPMFEFVGSIPHIDSDEDDDKDSVKSGMSSKRLEVARPKKITELPDKLLMSGINLPGTTDIDGRPIILCYGECIARAGLNKYEVAKLLLYYGTIPTASLREKGFTILLLAENEADHKTVETLDKSICLIGNSIKVQRFLVWSPGLKNSHRGVKTLNSRIQICMLTDDSSLKKFISKDQTPASCGGSCTHDQLEWVEFLKQLEPFLVACRTAGKCLLSTLSQLRSEEIPLQVTRRFLSHQCRQITKALESDTVQKLRREGSKTLTSLTERSQWLSSSGDVKRNVAYAKESYSAVEKVTKRLEQLKQERMERLKELARFKTLQDETDELISWTRKVGEETLNSLMLLLRSAGDAGAIKEVANDFEKFFFSAWRQIEKSNDLSEECKAIKDSKGQHLKEHSGNLLIQMKAFKEKLEDTRERIEDSSRCFLLLESCQDILDDDSKEQEEFVKLAQKSGNDKLNEICQVKFQDYPYFARVTLPNCPLGSAKRHETADQNQPPDKERIHRDKSPPSSSSELLPVTSTPIKPQNSSIRRRSVSSMAFIYHCSHHAAGEMCNCCESDTENTVSYKLKKKYIQTLHCVCNFGLKEPIERKNSGTLGGIKEESVENLLEKIQDHNDCLRCDSGVSTADNSVGDDSVYGKKKLLQRTCSCQYYGESCALCSAGSSSGGSNQDHTDNQQDSKIEESSDGFVKSNSSEDIEDDNFAEERRKVPPVSANNHLYCRASSLDLPSDALYHNMDPKTQKTLTYIIKEMVDTERDYVKSLDYVIVNYVPELHREDIPQALRGQRNTVFGNIEKIFEFHSQHFLNELEECMNNPLQVGHIFLKYDKKFYLYALYNKNKPKSDSLMSEYGSAFFKSKQLELEDKMDLASYLLKPVQRMGKYALLLQQMMKACPILSLNFSERGTQDLEDLKMAEEMVRFQLRHGNDLLAMDSIRECDVNLKEQGRLLRQNEFLVWEGKSGKKSLRQVFLFEELILFSKARRFPDRKNLDLYIYKNSIKMTDIGLTAKIGESPTKFEIWFRKRKPNDTFTLQSMTEDVKKIWTEELSQLLWRQAIKNRAVRMAEMSSMGIGNKPCLDIRPSDNQINDRSISFDQLSRTVPRFRNSIAGPIAEACRTVKRPHSVISMSSVSSSSSSSGGSGSTPNQASSIGLNYDSRCDSPKPFNRSATLNSQCSVESGIIADISVGSEESSEQAPSGL